MAQLPAGVRLVGVSKYHPVESLKEAFDAGLLDFGENRAQELVAKHAVMPLVRWHFIGHLQRNKVRSIIDKVELIQSVDSVELLRLLEKETERVNRRVNVLLQIHVAQEETKTGFLPSELIEAVESGVVADSPHVHLRGLMTMASFVNDTTQVEREFTQARRVWEQLSGSLGPDFNILSMGMSHDWKIAVDCGANMVRIGTSIFGERTSR